MSAAFAMKEKMSDLQEMVQDLDIKAKSPQAVKDAVYSKLNSLVFGNKEKVSIILSEKNVFALRDRILPQFGNFKTDIRKKGALCIITIRKADVPDDKERETASTHIYSSPPLKLVNEEEVISRVKKNNLRRFVSKVIDNLTKQKDNLGNIYNPIMFALSFLEVPYKFGATGEIEKNTGLPNKRAAVDCSAFVTHYFRYYLRQFENQYVRLQRLTTNALYKLATKYVKNPEEVADLKIGDVVVYPHRKGKPGHTAIIVGKNEDKITIVHASSSKGVTMREVDAKQLFNWFKHKDTMAVLSPTEPLVLAMVKGSSQA